MSEELPPAEVEYAPSDVIAVLNHLSELVGGARTLPMSASVLVNQAEVLELLHSAQDALPRDLVAADGIVADATAVLDRADLEAQQILQDAQNQAREITENANTAAQQEREQADAYASQTTADADSKARATLEEAQHRAQEIVESARAEAERLVSSETVVREAEERAQLTLQAADERAQQLSDGADQYCDEKLGELEKLLAHIAKQTRGGRATLAKRAGFEPAPAPVRVPHQEADFKPAKWNAIQE